jgi:DNA invertase Pin-like site-specific DNA recombinase
MARKKAVGLYEQTVSTDNDTFKRYRVGAYLRLSNEDAQSGTSASIENQGRIIETYLNDNPLEFELVDTYVDDGLTGVTDDRKNFQKMIDDCKAQKINCVVVKDGSRFARNYADCEYYVEQFFKIHRIRFICLGNPQVDSVKDPASVSGMQFHFTNYFNEYYVKQTSEKVIQTLKDKRKRGEFVSSWAPLGYKKDPFNKNKLIIDEDAADIIRKIFDLYVNKGFSMRQVCHELNATGVPSVLQYMRANGSKILPNNKPMVHSWNYHAIRKILLDERYCGHMVQGKTTTVSYKNKQQISKPKEEWDIVRNTHDPIIDEALFHKAAVMVNRISRVSPKGERSKYSRIVFCSKCGHTLNRKMSGREGRDYGYICKFDQMTKKCEPLHITQTALDERVLYAVRSQIAMLSELEQIYNKILDSNQYADESKILQVSLEKLEKQLQTLEAKSHRLYDSYDDGAISRDLYASRSKALNIEIEGVNVQIANVKKEACHFRGAANTTGGFIDAFKKYETVTEVDRELLVELVDKVFIENINDIPRKHNKTAKKVTVVFNFADEFKALEQFIEENKLIAF